MSNNYAVLGLGMMGEAIVFDLLAHDDRAKVFGFEISDDRRELLANKFGERFISIRLDLDLAIDINRSPLLMALKDNSIEVAFGAIDYKFNEYITKICLLAGTHFLDLGGNPDVVNAQRNLSKQAIDSGLTIIPDCGLAPGMANILAASIMDEFDELFSCKIRVGGLPQKPTTILKYQQVFSIRGLTNEYLEDAEVIRDGELIKVPSLSELERIEFNSFELPTLEAFQTAGGTSSLPILFKNRINELDYKTIRFDGHCQFIKFLKEFGLFSSEKYKNTNPRELVEHYLQKYLPRGDPDMVLIKITVDGIKNGSRIKTVFEIMDKMDMDTGYSAMARTTAFPISIIGIMLTYSIIKERGVVPGESVVPFDIFIKELTKRNIKIYRIDREI